METSRRARSRSRGRDRSLSHGSTREHDACGWNEDKQTLYDAMMSKVPNADTDVVCQTIDVLHDKGVTTEDQFKNIPHEVLIVFLPPQTHGKNLIFVNQVMVKYREEEKSKDPLTMAANSWAREAKNERKRKEGRDVDSSDDEAKPFILVDCLKKYGLHQIPSSHMQDTKLMKNQAKDAKNKAQSNLVWFPDPDILKQIPMWMRQDPPPKKIAGLENSASGHAKWVAAWWSTRLSQLAVQAYHETGTVSFQDVLTEFLHVNQMVAQNIEPKVGWEYDRKV